MNGILRLIFEKMEHKGQNMESRNVKKPIRVIALFLAAVLMAEFFSAAGLYPLNLRAQAAEAEAAEMPRIPVGKAYDDYNPEKDGYFAYLRVTYEVPVKSDTIEFKDAYIPVLCYKDCIYVRPDVLRAITNLKCDVYADNMISITADDGAFRVEMSVGDTGFRFRQGYAGAKYVPFRKGVTYLDVYPVCMDTAVYIPLIPVLRLFGMRTIIKSGENESDNKIYFEQHRENAIDVVMQLYAAADRNLGVAGSSFVPHAEFDAVSVAKGQAIDHTFGAFTIDPKAYHAAIPSLTMNKIDLRYYTEVVQGMLSTDVDLMRAMDDEAVKNTKHLMAAGLFIAGISVDALGEDVRGFDKEILKEVLADLRTLRKQEAQAAKNGIKFVADADYNELLKKYSVWEKADLAMDATGLFTDILCSLYENASIYVNRDTATAVGMSVLLRDEGDGKKQNPGSVFNTEEYHALVEEFKNFVPDQWVDEMLGKETKADKNAKNETTGTVLWKSADDVVLNVLGFLAGKISSELNVISVALSTLEWVLDAFHVSPVASANSLSKAYYGQILLQKVGTRLYDLMVRKEMKYEYKAKDYQELIALSYLYLRLGKLECDYLLKISDIDSEAKREYEDLSKMLSEKAAILASGCPRSPDDESVTIPYTIAGRIRSTNKAIEDSFPEKAVIPLYMKVSGTVLERTEGEPPVPDAVGSCFEKTGSNGYFGVDEEGHFSVYWSMKEPAEIVKDVEMPDERELIIKFSSETVKGQNSQSISFEPKGDIDLGNIYLSEFDWYQYINDNYVPEMGWADLEPATKDIHDSSYLKSWDYRPGLLSAQLTDLDNDGIEDCVLYFVDDVEKYSSNGDSGGEIDPASTIFVQYLKRNRDGTVTETQAWPITGGNGNSFCDVVGGILEFEGEKYIYFESNSFAYYANGYGCLYSFYNYDGSELCPRFAVGKTEGGSIQFAYSVVTNNDNGRETAEVVISHNYRTSWWSDKDGDHSVQYICGDSEWRRYHSEEKTMIDSYDPPQAMMEGLSSVTDITPGEVTVENSDNPYAFGNTYISYRNMDCFTQAFHYNCGGLRTEGDNRRVTVTLEDNTDLKRHVEETVMTGE